MKAVMMYVAHTEAIRRADRTTSVLNGGFPAGLRGFLQRCSSVHVIIGFFPEMKDHAFSYRIDPRVRPTVTAGSDNCFYTCRSSVPTFQNKTYLMFATGKTVGLTDWIIDDICLFFLLFKSLYLIILIIVDDYINYTVIYLSINLVNWV